MTHTLYAPRVFAHPTRTGARRATVSIRLLVVHTSEGGELSGSAESLARFIASPASSGNVASYHYIADTDDVIPIVPDDRVAFSNAGANHDGLSICHPGRANQTAAQWADPNSAAQLEQVACWLADKSTQYKIPLEFLPVFSVLAGRRGVCGHNEVSLAYRKSTHTDPGPNYPWKLVLDRARQLAGAILAPTPKPPRPSPLPSTTGAPMFFIAQWHTGDTYLVHPTHEWKRKVTGNDVYMHLIGAGVYPLVNDRALDGWLSSVPEV